MDSQAKKIYNAEYYKNNKNILRKKASERVECSCGVKVVRCSYARHLSTKKHVTNLKRKAADFCIINNEIMAIMKRERA